MGTARATTDLDYLDARLHGRRSRMAEAERLDALSRLRSLPELARAVAPGLEPSSTREFQAWLVERLAEEVAGFLPFLEPAGATLVEWLLVRHPLEALKDRYRETRDVVPDDRTTGAVRRILDEALSWARAHPQPFFFEAALDRGYFAELLARVEALPPGDRQVVAPMMVQDVDRFHLRLVARGRFVYGVAAELLLPMHVDKTRISRRRFAAMLQDPNLFVAAGRAVGRALDEPPAESVDAAELEALAWERSFRMANRAFRRGPIGLGAVVGYVGLRRVEVANLITLSEGIRTGEVRLRLTPRA